MKNKKLLEAGKINKTVDGKLDKDFSFPGESYQRNPKKNSKILNPNRKEQKSGIDLNVDEYKKETGHSRKNSRDYQSKKDRGRSYSRNKYPNRGKLSRDQSREGEVFKNYS